MRCVVAIMLFIAAPIIVSMLSMSAVVERSDVDVVASQPEGGLARLVGFAHDITQEQ